MGRSPRNPIDRNLNEIRPLLALGHTMIRIARAQRIARATLRRHYFVEQRQADAAFAIFESEQIRKQNVGAIKEMGCLVGRSTSKHVEQ